jgi:hypothetical protein
MRLGQAPLFFQTLNDYPCIPIICVQASTNLASMTRQDWLMIATCRRQVRESGAAHTDLAAIWGLEGNDLRHTLVLVTVIGKMRLCIRSQAESMPNEQYLGERELGGDDKW